MSEPAEPRRSRASWASWLALSVMVVAALAAVVALKTCGRGSDLAQAALQQVPEWLEKFRTGTITQRFESYTTEARSTGGDVLELAVLQDQAILRREDSRSVLWDRLYLGTTVSEIRVPVTFRYHLKLSDPWRVAARGNVCLVLAPPLRPSLPPAIDTARMEKETASGWARFNKEPNLDELERGITPELTERAGDKRHLALVREQCRRSVAEYLKRWLLKEDVWREDRFHTVVVVFPDEHQFASDKELEEFQEKPPLRP